MLIRIWIFINLLLWLSSFAVMVAVFDTPFIYLSMLSASFIMTVILLYVRRGHVKSFFSNKTNQNYLTHITRIFLVAIILALVNYLVYKNSRTIDVTSSQLHKLSDQTIKVLEAVDKKVSLKLFSSRPKWNQYLQLINMYENLNKNIEVEAIDSETNPSLVKAYGVQAEGTVVLEQAEKKVQAVIKDELSLTNLFIKLNRDKKILIYYTTGHGEVDLNSGSNEGGDYLKKILLQSLYELRPLNLMEVREVPKDADLLFMLGPNFGVVDREIELIKSYLEKGGNLLLTLGPQFVENKVQNLHDFLVQFGIDTINSVVVDRLSQMQGTNATIPMVKEFNQKHPITKEFSGRVIYPLTSAFVVNEQEGIKSDILFYSATFPSSWAETNLDALKKGDATYDSNDFKGPNALAVALYDKTHFSKIVLTGSTSFVINGYQNQSPNFNLLLNMMSWLVDDQGLTSLNRPGLKQERIFISTGQSNLIFYISIIIAPFLFFGIGIYFYRRRLKL
jgi:ABC-type uncharacterized transport system involved in gliding motility auxiliary subunit